MRSTRGPLRPAQRRGRAAATAAAARSIPPRRRLSLALPTFFSPALLATLLLPSLLPCRAGASAEGDSDSSAGAAGGPTVRLSNGRTDLPLIGVGVGNLAHDLIPDVLGSAVGEWGHRLVDTAAASKNEKLVARAIAASFAAGGERGDDGESDDAVHVVTKVWYTHLGYERTRLSVSESLSNLGSDGDGSGPKIKVHVLIHWPRCYDRISWMNCEGEEDRLPQSIKDAGPPPRLDPDHAWKGSWRALEDLYEPTDGGRPASHGNAVLESIGVSNFEVGDVEALLSESRIPPHIYQGNVWTLLHDSRLVALLRERNVHFQAYNVMNGIAGQRDRAPNAYLLLEKIGRDLYAYAVRGADGPDHEEYPPFAAPTVVTALLVQSGVSVVPRASSPAHRRSNSPGSVASVPALPPDVRVEVEHAASALLRGEDLDHPSPMGADAVSVTFRNALELDTPVKVFWINAETGEEIPQHSRPLGRGEEMSVGSHPGHRFAAYAEGAEGRRRREFLVRADYGDHERFHVDEL